jgi:hypothetical protein
MRTQMVERAIYPNRILPTRPKQSRKESLSKVSESGGRSPVDHGRNLIFYGEPAPGKPINTRSAQNFCDPNTC